MCRKLLAAIFLLSFSGTGFSQTFFTKKKKNVRILLELYYAKENLATVFKETDFSLTVFFKDSTGNLLQTNYSYHFKKNGRCY